MATLSRSKIDQLGSRLKQGNITEDDLRKLDEYRRSFAEAYTTVVQSIRQQIHLEPTGRPAKSTSSIIEKLVRESIRLTQVQDIAGCRIIVVNVVEQERVVSFLGLYFQRHPWSIVGITPVMDYALPRSTDIPPLHMDHLETPSTLNPLGLKGVGESGALPVPAVLASAIENALDGYGLVIRQMPLTPATLAALIPSRSE